MALNTIGASMQSARALLAATETAGGIVPPVLLHIEAGYDLLSSQTAPSDPAKAIVAAAAEGELTQERLDQLCAEAATAQAVAAYRRDLQGRAENLFVEKFYRALCDGAADRVLDSLRPGFTEAATQLADALAIVDLNTPAAQLAEHGSPRELEAYRSIKPAVAKLDAVAAIAKRFGPRSVDWAVLDLPNIIDHRNLVDEAVMLTSSDLVQAGTVFRGRLADIHTIPWLRIKPRLNTISEAKERLREWASAEWETLNHATGRGHFEDGNLVEEMRVNPFADAVADA